MFFDFIPENFYPVIADYAKVLIPSLITYLVTRYSLLKPRRYEIRKEQFEKVYLPLYLLTKQLLASKDYQKNLPIYTRKFNKIVSQNYHLVYPKTIKLFDKLCNSNCSEEINLYHLTNFEYQIYSDYEKLKRELGYPTSSFYDFFKRLSRFNKIMYFFFFSLICFTVYLVVTSFLHFLSRDILEFVYSGFLASFMIFIIYILSWPIRH